MSEVKFTSGEWIAREDECSCVGDFEVVANIEDDGDYDLIAENIQCETDAHLIATAPEMYRMLELAMSYMDGDSIEDFVYSYQDIKQLLAKARGE